MSDQVTGSVSESPSVELLYKLRRTGRGLVTKVAWSPDGQLIAVPTQMGKVELWNDTGHLQRTIQAHGSTWTTNVTWSNDGRYLAASSGDNKTRIWRASDWERQENRQSATLALPGSAAAWDPRSEYLVTLDEFGRVYMCRTDTWSPVIQPIADGTCIGFSPSGTLGIGTKDGYVVLLDIKDAIRPEWPRIRLPGVRCLAWSPTERILAAGGAHGTICIFDVATGKRIAELEGHTRMVRSLSFSCDGNLLASKSDDGSVRVWSTSTLDALAIIKEPASSRVHGYTNKKAAGIAFHPKKLILATLGDSDQTVRIWTVHTDLWLAPSVTGVRYTTAKIVLVGDQGVGKTGLGWRLARGKFREHPSTHGQQFWVLERLHFLRVDKTECEAVLWDFAGQADYRLTHAVFLDRVDLALLLFDPGNHSEPLKGVQYWLRALDVPGEASCPKILVAARSDRAASLLTKSELQTFCDQNSITGGFVFTSAMTGEGLEQLFTQIEVSIAWDSMVSTVTTETFKRIKGYVLALKESSPSQILLDPPALEAELEAIDNQWRFTRDEMMTAIYHLANHGYVSVLRGSSGKETVLLFPEVLSNLASSFVLEARRNPAGLGALEEAKVLRGEYRFPELAGLCEKDCELLLDAVTALFLQRNICFRERLGSSTYLIFPSLINLKKPTFQQPEMTEDVSYTVTGRVENIYAALVVLLGYSNTFTRTNQWQNHAEYEMNPGEVCGFRQIIDREGEVDLVLYYGAGASVQARSLFQSLFEAFLLGRDAEVTKYFPITCPKCHYRPDRIEVTKRAKLNKDFLFCGECSTKISLPPAVVQKANLGTAKEALVRDQQAATTRTRFETALTRLKGFLRDTAEQRPPVCFISYAWGVEEHEKWVSRMARDLENADIEILIDRKNNAAVGSSVTAFVNRIEETAFVIVVGTPEYLLKYNNIDETRGTFVAAEMDLINQRLTGTKGDKDSVLPLVLSGDKTTSLPPLLRGRVYADFRNENNYFSSLFDLILALYSVSPDQENVSDLRVSIQEGDDYLGS